MAGFHIVTIIVTVYKRRPFDPGKFTLHSRLTPDQLFNDAQLLYFKRYILSNKILVLCKENEKKTNKYSR